MLEIEFKNQSNFKGKINLEQYRQIAESIIDKLGFSNQKYLIELTFVNNSEMRKLNCKYLKNNKITDVISFPQIIPPEHLPEKNLGSIIIAPEYAEKTHQKLINLFKHGLLHLLGYDHETAENEWLIAEAKININQK